MTINLIPHPAYLGGAFILEAALSSGMKAEVYISLYKPI
jgi:hypothetical protein